jgi:hypothetical protein
MHNVRMVRHVTFRPFFLLGSRVTHTHKSLNVEEVKWKMTLHTHYMRPYNLQNIITLGVINNIRIYMALISVCRRKYLCYNIEVRNNASQQKSMRRIFVYIYILFVGRFG